MYRKRGRSGNQSSFLEEIWGSMGSIQEQRKEKVICQLIRKKLGLWQLEKRRCLLIITRSEKIKLNLCYRCVPVCDNGSNYKK